MFIIKQLKLSFSKLLFLGLNSSETNLIVAMDGLGRGEVSAKLKEIQGAGLEGEEAEEYAKYMERTIWKVNDLLAGIGFEGLEEVFKDVKGGVFIDGKWHDIGNTDANCFKQLANYRYLAESVKYVTMHASNGEEGLKKAVEARNSYPILKDVKILAVTALTSLTDYDTNIIFDENRMHSVLKLAELALKSGVDGIVCSSKEAQVLRDVFSKDYPNFLIIIAGVRFKGENQHDQKNVETPAIAKKNGADDIVMGRPILESENPADAVRKYFREIHGVLFESDEHRHEFERILYTGNWEELLRHIGAFYNRPEGGKYCRLKSELLSNAYINIGASERNYLVVEKAANDLAKQVKEKGIKADVVMGAQMGSVRLSLALAEKLAIGESIYAEKVEYSDVDSIAVGNDSGRGGENVVIGSKGLGEKVVGNYYRKLESHESSMILKRHDIDLDGKKVILSEDIVTKGTTLEQMIKLVQDNGGEVVGITCVGNRYGEDNFNGIPLLSCYTPPEFELYWDENTPVDAREDYPKLPEGSLISEKPKYDWSELHGSMRA